MTRARTLRVGMSAALVVCGVGACVRRGPVVVTDPTRVVVERRAGKVRAPRPAIRWYDDVWRAIAALDFVNAWTVAETADERRLVDALQWMADGLDARADTALAPLLGVSDTMVRRAARLAVGALWSSRGEWGRLAELSAAVPSGVEKDAAGVEAWAPAFAGVRTRRRFEDSVAVLPLTRSPTGVPVVPVRINGVVRYFWLDTGSSITILSSAAAVACGVKPVGGEEALQLVTAVGRIGARPAVVEELRIGGAVVERMPVMVVDSAVFRMKSGVRRADGDNGSFMSQYYPIDGVIGFDVIRMLDLTIDDVQSQVVVRRPVARPRLARGEAPRNLFWFGLPIVTLMAENGSRIHLSLDTGAEETYGTRSLVSRGGVRAVGAERRMVSGFGGTAAERGVVVSRMRLFLDDVPLLFERVFLYNAEYPTIFHLDGTLGADLGRGGVVRIDMTNGRVESR